MTKSEHLEAGKLIDKVRTSINRIIKDSLVIMDDEEVRRYWWVSIVGSAVGTVIPEPPTKDGWFLVCVAKGHDVVYDNSWLASSQILSEDRATIDRILNGGFRNAYKYRENVRANQ